jgi:hypothetical protein
MKPALFITFLLFSIASIAQIDSAFILKLKALDTANTLQADTMALPDDVLTKKIKQLRAERSGGLTTEAVLKIKLAEEQGKDKKHDAAFYKKLEQDITTGHTAQLLENIMINLYRRTFTESEIDELVRFYKTSAAKKMDKEFLLMMVQSVKDAEQLLKLAVSKLESQK